MQSFVLDAIHKTMRDAIQITIDNQTVDYRNGVIFGSFGQALHNAAKRGLVLHCEVLWNSAKYG